MTRKKEVPALLLATTVTLAGCGFGTSQTPVGSTIDCCQLAGEAVYSAEVVAYSCADSTRDISGGAESNGFEARGGNAWIAKNGEYCAGEGSAVGFPDGTWIEGPSQGIYSKE